MPNDRRVSSFVMLPLFGQRYQNSSHWKPSDHPGTRVSSKTQVLRYYPTLNRVAHASTNSEVGFLIGDYI